MSFLELNPRLGSIDGLVAWSHQEFHDIRGSLTKTYDQKIQELGGFHFLTSELFYTTSFKNVFRGMHFQSGQHATSKIVTVLSGRILDFTLDLRPESGTFSNLNIRELDSANGQSIFIPKDVAHGYLVLENDSRVIYRMETSFCKHCDFGINPSIVANYIPVNFRDLILSERDLALPVDFSSLLQTSNHL